MIEKITSEELFVTEEDWRVSRYHFSFADYRDPNNLHYGVLSALNDETIYPNRGFDLHPHHNMEILSYCIKGELTHRDNLGNDVTIRRGDVQYMCSGTGITHAEMNNSMDQILRFMQIWILPHQTGLTPQYGHKRSLEQSRQNKLMQIASGSKTNGAFQINQDANIFVSEIQKGKRVLFEQPHKRQNYIVCIEGNLETNGIMLSQYEAARISGETQLRFSALEDAHLLLVEIAEE